MKAKNSIIATLVGTVSLFLLGWIFYGMLLMDFNMQNAGSATGVMREESEMVWWALILGNVVQAYFLVYIFERWENVNSFVSGLKGGAVIGFLLGLGFNLVMYATSNMMNLTAALVDPFVSMAMMGITGGLIGMILGKK
ncbi:MAG: DUF1761 domain-containing protein [Cyclobacteriaceae bacterium]|nr:DUF1761 domain-containing protein [Cyclobacteriaceae bacterium SS2]